MKQQDYIESIPNNNGCTKVMESTQDDSEQQIQTTDFLVQVSVLRSIPVKKHNPKKSMAEEKQNKSKDGHPPLPKLLKEAQWAELFPNGIDKAKLPNIIYAPGKLPNEWIPFVEDSNGVMVRIKDAPECPSGPIPPGSMMQMGEDGQWIPYTLGFWPPSDEDQTNPASSAMDQHAQVQALNAKHRGDQESTNPKSIDQNGQSSGIKANPQDMSGPMNRRCRSTFSEPDRLIPTSTDQEGQSSSVTETLMPQKESGTLNLRRRSIFPASNPEINYAALTPDEMERQKGARDLGMKTGKRAVPIEEDEDMQDVVNDLARRFKRIKPMTEHDKSKAYKAGRKCYGGCN